MEVVAEKTKEAAGTRTLSRVQMEALDMVKVVVEVKGGIGNEN
jgi:hypothetical protein